MSEKAKIKIIKKGEMKIAEQTMEKPIVIEKKSKQAAREMVSTVSNWVNELQQRRRDETKQAIEKFFTPQQPQADGV